MIGIKNIQDVVHAKQLEIVKVIEQALEQRDAELRQLQRTLVESLRVVNRLLENDDTVMEVAQAASASTSHGPIAVLRHEPR